MSRSGARDEGQVSAESSTRKLPPILVLFGGRSEEAEVSVVSGTAIAAALLDRGAHVEQVLICRDGGAVLLPAGHRRGGRLPVEYTGEGGAEALAGNERRDLLVLLKELQAALPRLVAIPALHGPRDEDGEIQALLASAGINYVGAEPKVAALGMDKPLFKELAAAAGVPVLPHLVIDEASWRSTSGHERRVAEMAAFAARHSPAGALIGKPAAHGSSIGMRIARTPTEWSAAVDLALEHGDRALLEPYLDHPRELEVAILEKPDGSIAAYGPGEVFPGHDFYDYEAKYSPGVSRTTTTPEIDTALRSELLTVAGSLFRSIGGRGLARLDFLAPREGGWFVSEINTFPGFTPISLYPQLLGAAGIPFDELCALLVASAVEHPAQGVRPTRSADEERAQQ